MHVSFERDLRANTLIRLDLAFSERIKIAKAISEMIVQKYANEILLVAVYGSVARKEETAHLDIDVVRRN